MPRKDVRESTLRIKGWFALSPCLALHERRSNLIFKMEQEGSQEQRIRLQTADSNTGVITEYLMFNKIPFCYQLSQRPQLSSANRENSKYIQQKTE